jgi:hypothetical protein
LTGQSTRRDAPQTATQRYPTHHHDRAARRYLLLTGRFSLILSSYPAFGTLLIAFIKRIRAESTS